MRYLLRINYDGSNYSGFQVQINKNTIQANLEKCLSQVIGQEIKIVASGRTDAGVSALEQVCHFDIEQEIDIRRTIGYTNKLLPEDIRVMDIVKVSNDFHARFSAKKKTYEYYVYTGMKSAIYDKFATHIGLNINISNIKNACKEIIGEYDFSAFCASNTDVINKVRTIYNFDFIEVNDNLYKFSITGNGFLYNMVRIIVGTFVSIGLGKISKNDLKTIINSKDRNLAGKTMPSKGLVLKKVYYINDI